MHGNMRIEEDIKLDYADVLFRPKRSTLHSRKDVELIRTYTFKYSNHQWSGIPIMAANMDGVGELENAKNLAKFKLMTCFMISAHRFLCFSLFFFIFSFGDLYAQDSDTSKRPFYQYKGNYGEEVVAKKYKFKVHLVII